jgi:ankyrin repeat protein
MGDVYDKLTNTPLIEAVRGGQAAAVKELIEAGADVNEPGEQGWTPLNWAAGRGDLGLVTLLLESGADVFKVGRDQRTPNMIALAAGHAEVVKFLREAEDRAEGEKPDRPQRSYCKAYHLKDLRQFADWSESRVNWKKADDERDGQSPDEQLGEDDVVFLHQDYTVTQSIWADENVIFNNVTPAWEEFCGEVLRFKVPDDLDLLVAADGATSDPDGATAGAA